MPSFCSYRCCFLSPLLTHGLGWTFRDRTPQYPRKIHISLSLPTAERLRAASTPRAWGRTKLCCWRSLKHLSPSLRLFRPYFLNVTTQTPLLIFGVKRLCCWKDPRRFWKAVITSETCPAAVGFRFMAQYSHEYCKLKSLQFQSSTVIPIARYISVCWMWFWTLPMAHVAFVCLRVPLTTRGKGLKGSVFKSHTHPVLQGSTFLTVF